MIARGAAEQPHGLPGAAPDKAHQLVLRIPGLDQRRALAFHFLPEAAAVTALRQPRLQGLEPGAAQRLWFDLCRRRMACRQRRQHLGDRQLVGTRAGRSRGRRVAVPVLRRQHTVCGQRIGLDLIGAQHQTLLHAASALPGECVIDTGALTQPPQMAPVRRLHVQHNAQRLQIAAHHGTGRCRQLQAQHLSRREPAGQRLLHRKQRGRLGRTLSGVGRQGTGRTGRAADGDAGCGQQTWNKPGTLPFARRPVARHLDWQWQWQWQ